MPIKKKKAGKLRFVRMITVKRKGKTYRKRLYVRTYISKRTKRRVRIYYIRGKRAGKMVWKRIKAKTVARYLKKKLATRVAPTRRRRVIKRRRRRGTGLRKTRKGIRLVGKRKKCPRRTHQVVYCVRNVPKKTTRRKKRKSTKSKRPRVVFV